MFTNSWFYVKKFISNAVIRCDYDHMRALASITTWHSLQDDDVDNYALNLTNKTLHIAKECIPN